MKKITYQIILSDDAYVECLDKLGKLMLFPADGNMVFKVEEIGEDGSREIIVDDAMYDLLKDYLKAQSIKSGEEEE